LVIATIIKIHVDAQSKKPPHPDIEILRGHVAIPAKSITESVQTGDEDLKARCGI